MAPSDFAKADIESIVAQLTPDEAASLTAGVGWWHTAAIPRLGVPAIKVRTAYCNINASWRTTYARCRSRTARTACAEGDFSWALRRTVFRFVLG